MRSADPRPSFLHAQRAPWCERDIDRAQSRKGEYSAAGPDGAKLAESWSFSAESNTVMMTVNPLSENPLNRSGLALRHRVIHPYRRSRTDPPSANAQFCKLSLAGQAAPSFLWDQRCFGAGAATLNSRSNSSRPRTCQSGVWPISSKTLPARLIQHVGNPK
jgi:hypothetical protein